MNYRKYKRNTPTGTLIKNYVNKRSGKVREARKEIERRFDYLDWVYQKKIMAAFLESGKADREWVYSKLLGNWDPSLEPKVKEVWELYHESKCAWVVISHLPEEYLMEQMKMVDHFADGRNYYFLCRRLANIEGFRINKDRLAPIDYLRLMFHLGWKPSDEEVMDCVFRTVYEAVWEHYSQKEYFFYGLEYGDIPSVKQISQVKQLFTYLWKDPFCNKNIRCICDSMECKKKFNAWCEKVGFAISNSKEFHDLMGKKYDYEEYNRRCFSMLLVYSYLSLDERYTKNDKTGVQFLPPYENPFITNMNNGGSAIHEWTDEEKEKALADFYKELQDNNAAFGDLVETFDLEPAF